MTATQILGELNNVVNILQSLSLDPEQTREKNKIVSNIRKISDLIVQNSLKEGTKALKDATNRLREYNIQLGKDKKDMEKTAKNLKKTASILGAIVSTIKFV